MRAFPCLGQGWEASSPRLALGTVAPSSAGLLLATAQEEKEAGSYRPPLMPVCRHFCAHLPNQDHPPSSLYPLPRRRKLGLREEKLAAQGCAAQRGGEARRVLRASLQSPSTQTHLAPEHLHLPHHEAQCHSPGACSAGRHGHSLQQGQVWIQSLASAC